MAATTKKHKLTPESVESQSTPRGAKRLYRSEGDRILGGVCGGLAEYLEIDATLVRILFLIVTLFGGSGVLVYFILWLLIPSYSQLSMNSEDVMKSNIEEMQAKGASFAKTAQIQRDNSKYLLGIILLGLGVLFLLRNMGIMPNIDFGKFWPILLIIFGFFILSKKS